MTSIVPAFTFSLKLPSKSVTVPFDVPFSITVAPMTGPMSSSTVPVISVCAYIIVLTSKSIMLSSARLSPLRSLKNLFIFSICFYVFS